MSQESADFASTRAAAAFRQGNFAQAEQILRALLARNPTDADALGFLGGVLDAQEKYDEAERCYQRALALAPNSVSLLNNSGNHYLARGNPDRARAQFLRVVAKDPAHANANLQLARIAVDGRRGAEALRYLHRLPGNAQPEPAVQLLQLEALHWAGEQKSAEALAGKLERAAAGDPRVLFSFGMTLAHIEDYRRAEATFSRVLEAKPEDFDTLYNLALAADLAGHPDRAQWAFEAALKQQPDDPAALYQFGRFLAARQEYDRAIILLARASKVAPPRTDVLLTLARALSHGGYYGDAALAYDQYVKLRPQDDIVRRDRAVAYGLSTRRGEAIAELTWYTQQHPNDPVGYYNFGLLYEEIDQEAARKHFERALKLKPDYDQARYGLAVVIYSLGKPAEALPEFKALAERHPNDVPTLDRLGLTHLALGQSPEAEAVLRRALKLSPDDRTVLMHLGRALKATGQNDEATKVLAKLEILGPAKTRAHQISGVLAFLSGSEAEEAGRCLQSAQRLVKEGRDREALELLDQFDDLYPEQRDLLLATAIVLALLNDGEAERLLAQIQERWPEWSGSFFASGVIFQTRSRYHEGRRMLESALALGLHTPEAYYHLAEAISADEPRNTEGALQVVSEGLALRPDDAPAQALAGRILFERQDYEKAAAHLKEAIRLRPDCVEAHQNLSKVYAALGEKAESTAELEIVSRLRQQQAANEGEASPIRELLLSLRLTN